MVIQAEFFRPKSCKGDVKPRAEPRGWCKTRGVVDADVLVQSYGLMYGSVSQRTRSGRGSCAVLMSICGYCTNEVLLSCTNPSISLADKQGECFCSIDRNIRRFGVISG